MAALPALPRLSQEAGATHTLALMPSTTAAGRDNSASPLSVSGPQTSDMLLHSPALAMWAGWAASSPSLPCPSSALSTPLSKRLPRQLLMISSPIPLAEQAQLAAWSLQLDKLHVPNARFEYELDSRHISGTLLGTPLGTPSLAGGAAVAVRPEGTHSQRKLIATKPVVAESVSAEKTTCTNPLTSRVLGVAVAAAAAESVENSEALTIDDESPESHDKENKLPRAAAGVGAASTSKTFTCPFAYDKDRPCFHPSFSMCSRHAIRRHVMACAKDRNAALTNKSYEEICTELCKQFSSQQLKGFVFRKHKQKRDKNDTPYHSRWYCPHENKGCKEFYVATSSTTKAKHLQLCPFQHAEVTLSPPALATQQARLKEEADKRAAIFERNQVEIAGREAATAGGEAETAGGDAETAGGEAATAGAEAETAGGDAETAGWEAATAGGEAEQPCLQQESAEAALGWERFSAPARSSGPDSALSRKVASSKRNTFGVSEKYQTPAKNKEKDMAPGLFGVRAHFTHLRLPLSPLQQRTLFKKAQALPIINAVDIGAIKSPLGLQSENVQRRPQCQTSQCLSENVVAAGNSQQPAVDRHPLHQQQPQYQFALPRASLTSSLPVSALPGTPLAATAVEMHPLALQKTQWSNMGPTEADAASAARAKRKVDDSGSKQPKRPKYAPPSAAGVEGTYPLHPDPFFSMSIYNNPPAVFGQLPPPGKFITTQELPLGVTTSSSPNTAPQLSICHQPINSCSGSGSGSGGVGTLRTDEAQLELPSTARLQQQSLQAQPHFFVHSSPQRNSYLNFLPSPDRDAQVHPCIDYLHMVSPAQLRHSNSHQLTLLQRPGQSGPVSIGFYKAPDSGSPHLPAKPTKQPLATDPISPVMKACCWRQQMLEASPNGAATAAGGVDIRAPKPALLDADRAAFASLRMQAGAIREQESQQLATKLVAQPPLLKTQRVELTAQRKHGAQQLAANQEQLQTQSVLPNSDRFGESLPPVPSMMHLSTSPFTSDSLLMHQQHFQARPNFSSGTVYRKEQGQKMLDHVVQQQQQQQQQRNCGWHKHDHHTLEHSQAILKQYAAEAEHLKRANALLQMQLERQLLMQQTQQIQMLEHPQPPPFPTQVADLERRLQLQQIQAKEQRPLAQQQAYAPSLEPTPSVWQDAAAMRDSVRLYQRYPNPPQPQMHRFVQSDRRQLEQLLLGSSPLNSENMLLAFNQLT